MDSTPKRKIIKRFKDIQFNEPFSPKTSLCALKVCQQTNLRLTRKLAAMRAKLHRRKKQILSLKGLVLDLKRKFDITENSRAALQVFYE